MTATPVLALVQPYYTNPGMLAHQYRVWADYPDFVKAQLEVVIVDDGSPDAAIDVPRPAGLPALRIYRVLEDRPWHQHAARNLGAHEAAAPWLLLTDMDHVVPAPSCASLLARLDAAPDVVFTFHRLDAPTLTPKLKDGRAHPHPNTFALRRARYWAVGGYDEDLCGFYGTDGYFRKRLFGQAREVHLHDVPIVRFPREVIADASTRADREAGRRTTERNAVLRRKGPHSRPTVLAFPWERVL